LASISSTVAETPPPPTAAGVRNGSGRNFSSGTPSLRATSRAVMCEQTILLEEPASPADHRRLSPP